MLGSRALFLDSGDKMAKGKEHTFSLVFDCTGRGVGKLRNEMTVRLVEPELIEWEMASDEHGFHGGEGTAPLPVAYFAAGLTSCFMTQVRAFAKRMRIPLNNVWVYCRCEWKGTQSGRDPYVSAPVGFHMDIELDSDASLEDQKRLLDAAQKGCFIEAMMRQPNTITHRLKTAEGWEDV